MPSAYKSKYGEAQLLGDLSDVFGDGSAKHRAPLVTRTPRAIITGADPSRVIISSFDPRYIGFLKKLTEAMNEAITPELDHEGFSLNGAHATADNLSCVAGYMMNPMTYTAFSNEAYRASLGLRPGYTARERRIALNVWRLVFSEWTPSDVKVPMKSSSGTPRYTSDAEWKREFALWLFEPSNLEECLQLIAKEDRRELARRYEMIWMTYIQTRLQPESIKKKREVMDRDYAMSNGRRGKLFPADKHVNIEGRDYPEMSAMRARVIQAGPWSINCLLQVIFSGTMRSMFRRWPDLFHVNTPEKLTALLDGHHIYAGDVKEYDRSMSKDALDVAHEAMAEVWDDRLAKASADLYYAPYYCRPLELDGTRGTFFGDPFDPGSSVVSGNKSGHAGTSVIAKVNKVIDDLIVIDKITGDVEGSEDGYMGGRRHVKIINNGDDHVVYSRDRSFITQFRKRRADPHAGHYIVEEEKGQVFSGYILMKTETVRGPTYKAHRRLLTFLERMLVPERSAGSFMRRFWPIGMYERITTAAAANPLGSLALEVFLRTYRDTVEPDYGNFMALVENALYALPTNFAGLDAASRDVLEDPERIHYKYLDDEIDPTVLAMITNKIPRDAIRHIGARYFKGRIHETLNQEH